MKLRIRRRAEVGWRGTVEQGSGRVADTEIQLTSRLALPEPTAEQIR